jgi:hypothetical protein
MVLRRQLDKPSVVLSGALRTDPVGGSTDPEGSAAPSPGEPDNLPRGRCRLTKQLIGAQDGGRPGRPSYGEAVVTEAGSDRRSPARPRRLPRRGRSVNSLIADPPPGVPVPPILRHQTALFLDRRSSASFADVEATRHLLADSQRGVASAVSRRPAWKSRPSWYLVAPPPSPPSTALHVERRASVVEAEGSHAIYVRRPRC